MKSTLHYFIYTVAILLCSNTMFATTIKDHWEEDSSNHSSTKIFDVLFPKNESIIAIGHNQQYFINGKNNNLPHFPSFYIQYARYLNKWSALSFEYSHFAIGNWFDKERFDPGDIIQTTMALYRISYQLELPQISNLLQAQASLGLMYRHGGQLYHVTYFYFEQHLDSQRFRDLGISPGLRIQLRIIKNLHLGLAANYTNYFLIPGQGDPYSNFEVVAPNQQLSGQIMIGLKF